MCVCCLPDNLNNHSRVAHHLHTTTRLSLLRFVAHQSWVREQRPREPSSEPPHAERVRNARQDPLRGVITM